MTSQNRRSSDDLNIPYIREHSSPTLSSLSSSPSSSSLLYARPRAPLDDLVSSPRPSSLSNSSNLPSTVYPDAPSAEASSPAPSFSDPSWNSPLVHSPSSSEPPFFPDHISSAAFARPPKASMPLPDPSQFPDPYPFRHPHHHLTSLPALSSAGSSSTSTRSSAYTTSGSGLVSGDYGHIHVASGEDESATVGITSEAVVQMLASDPAASASARGPLHRTVVPDYSRWSESYSASVRSRSSSFGNNISNGGHESSAPALQQKPSYDISWTVDEKDEAGISEDETDDEPALDDVEGDIEDSLEERTSAAVVAEEGRGLIVQADNVPVVQLQIQPGTTHLLMGSSTTPNAVPSFLTASLPNIATTLLALDISANFLGALPPVLAVCENLEELNVASNPLRVLPVFLAELSNLRLLIADSTGISTLPEALVELEKLHTVSVRRNKLHALPSWLCLLPALQTLCIDGNPFQGPWKALVEPLLAKTPMTPVYPPSTPIFPLPSASIQSSHDAETDNTDIEDLSDHDPSSPHARNHLPEEEDQTITPERAPFLGRSVTAPLPIAPDKPSNNVAISQPKPLTRTRTTPNRAHFDQTRTKKVAPLTDLVSPPPKQGENPGHFPDHELRKMKSAGDLRRGRSATVAPTEQGSIRPTLSHYPTSLSSSNLLNMNPSMPEHLSDNKRFASLGRPSGAPSRPPINASRPQLSKSLWNGDPDSNNSASPNSNRISFTPSNAPSNHSIATDTTEGRSSTRRPSTRDGKEKGSRWGFLKKMSMGKMKIDTPTPTPSPSPVVGNRVGGLQRPHTSAGSSARALGSTSTAYDRSSKSPQIDVRFSTTGTLDALPVISSPSNSPSRLSKQPSRDLLKVSSPPPTGGFLSPPLAPPRSTKRRSFLPVEAPGTLSLNIPIPETSAFVTGLTASNDTDEQHENRGTTPSPAIDSEQYLRREEERAREAYMRALRSVMAYLKDMNDLGASQQANPLSMYGTSADDPPTVRSRRPTVTDGSREVSMALSGFTDVAAHLRPSESLSGLRNGTLSQTLSVATTDSSSSMEERKFKDDKGKRAMVVREIVVTERTYVKGLQELVDIYIKPASISVNLLSGVGSGKDTVVPASERKIVFGGIDALFSFHKDSFLPALEVAAAPLMKPSPELQAADHDGQLSLNVAKAVGNIFLKHAAFMKMYSSYINNFDSSVQRVKHWSTERSAGGNASPASAISPSSSTAQLVGLGLSMAIVSPVLAESGAAATGVPNISTSQRKRIKSYLKRCRMNPRHTQLNLEGYLLLPVQRIPRYRLLLEELLRSTPPTYEYMEDPLDRALAEISSLANNMNEGKRESESRRKLVQWQTRIRGKFPSPLVQPHRRLIMDGPLLLTRVVRKAVVSFEAINAQGDASTVQVDCLAPELTPRPLVGILCNDLLVLCRDPSEGKDSTSYVDLWAVLRMQTLPQPASIVHGNALRLVDNKAILYFDAPSPSAALNWYRAINLHIPASKT